MKIAFTLCSNNYLAQAKALGDSLKKFNPDYEFVIGLVDEFDSKIDYNFFESFTIIKVADIGIPDFNSIWQKYNIVEFNTCVKASFFKFLFNANPDVTALFYFDPDIIIYESLKILEQEFDDNDILITPHIISPIEPDSLTPEENRFLTFGLYNLGFIGISRNTMETGGFLNWWEKRTLEFGYHDISKGMFVDQLWINFVPLFFEKVKILFQLGCNVAPWNLHERSIVKNENEDILMNDGSKLIFYHFSSYKFNTPDKMSINYERYNFSTHPGLIALYKEYRELLIQNKIEHFSSFPCTYILNKQRHLDVSQNSVYKKNIKKIFKNFVPPILLKIKNYRTRNT